MIGPKAIGGERRHVIIAQLLGPAIVVYVFRMVTTAAFA
jgi:hypothetical protein